MQKERLTKGVHPIHLATIAENNSSLCTDGSVQFLRIRVIRYDEWV